MFTRYAQGRVKYVQLNKLSRALNEREAAFGCMCCYKEDAEKCLRGKVVYTLSRLFPCDCILVDPASCHMLVSKIKPCMSKYTL